MLKQVQHDNTTPMEKKIIISIIVLFFVSSVFLLYNEEKDQDLNYQKNWWIVYFQEPKSDELNFVIENHSDSNEFTWKITKNRRTMKEGKAVIEKGSTQNIEISDVEKSGKIIIEVEGTEDGNKKIIYRNY